MLRRLKPPLSISGDRMPSDSVMAFCTSGVAVAVYSDRQKRCQTRMLIVQVSTGMLNQCRKSKHNLKSAVNRQSPYIGAVACASDLTRAMKGTPGKSSRSLARCMYAGRKSWPAANCRGLAMSRADTADGDVVRV